ncbi:MAG: family 20 glycosylhydrolase [Ignavibacteriales bacterium]|nr:family 20 glycosylhydrolase [Ignavibacteriales bacterium]
MGKLTVATIILGAFMLTANAQQNERDETRRVYDLLPVPASVEAQAGVFRIDSNFAVAIGGKIAEDDADRLERAATRFLRRLDGRTGLFLPQPSVRKETAPENAAMVVEVNRREKTALGMDESYKIEITPGRVRLVAKTDIGAIRGFETILQLLDADDEGYFFPAVGVKDAPRFEWRGLMIDVCRHWMPMEVILRNIDAMAAAKLNTLHLHLSEDQGFRVESKIYPKLHELGSDGNYFSQEQLRRIVRYADDRGVRVYPEFDVPGHATAWLVGYPELATSDGPFEIEREWGIHEPTMDPTKEYVYEFLDNFFGEMAPIFPDEYFHIGGDEVKSDRWDASERVQTFMRDNEIEDVHELQAYFNKRVLDILEKHGKTMVGWDEILHPDVPTDAVIHSWRGKESVAKAAREGYFVILSNGYYIDLIHSAEQHYLNDPLPKDIALTDAEKKNVLGGEATSWAELVTPETVDSRIWPRTAVIAERLWSPQEVDDVPDMYRRMYIFSRQIEELGVTHIRNYEMMLRRLTGGAPIEPLKTLVDVIQPVPGYKRHFQGVKYYQYSPYTRAVDAARPESRTAREFELMVDEYVAGHYDHMFALKAQLERWRDNRERLAPTMATSPIIRELTPHSENLHDLAKKGLDAIEYFHNNETPSGEWADETTALVKLAQKPAGQTNLVVVAAIAKLTNAALEQ